MHLLFTRWNKLCQWSEIRNLIASHWSLLFIFVTSTIIYIPISWMSCNRYYPGRIERLLQKQRQRTTETEKKVTEKNVRAVMSAAPWQIPITVTFPPFNMHDYHIILLGLPYFSWITLGGICSVFYYFRRHKCFRGDCAKTTCPCSSHWPFYIHVKLNSSNGSLLKSTVTAVWWLSSV